jgi:undecaprenyl-diphosphatase
MNDYLISIILGVIEGLTEFLPVSSTAHLRLAQGLLDLPLDEPYWKMYAVVIQLGAVLAVVVYFWNRIVEFLRSFPRGTNGDRTAMTHPLTLVIGAFVVTAGPAYLLDKKIGENLENFWVIGGALLVGGVLMWVVDAIYGKRADTPLPAEEHPGPLPPGEHAPAPSPVTVEYAPVAKGRGRTMDTMSWPQAVWIGAAQILSAAFPGTSRSMATIAAGQVAGLTRSAALEFSFFLSIPVMFAATGFKLLQAVMGKSSDAAHGPIDMTAHRWGVLVVGFVVSFVVAWAVIAWFMAWVRRRGFVPFAVYRIVVGIVVLAWAMSSSGAAPSAP